MSMFRNRSVGALLAAFTASSAHGQPVFTTSHGIEFSTISDVGNPVVPQSVGPVLYLGTPPTLIGAVNYEFRMARTEVTVGQWHEFVSAYRPHYTAGNPNFLPFTGQWIQWSQSQQQYVYNPANERLAIDPSWRVAAAYCNWLHNDKRPEAWAFASGAYDTSTFTTNPDGTVNDQPTHSPGARYWIPTLDEWTKAMYWDPDRYGQGQGGYWAYPHQSDEPPVPGVPGVGQTSGGLQGPQEYFPVGSYPTVQSPWGLWDGSGSEAEWTELLEIGKRRSIKGSQTGGTPAELADRVDWPGGSSPAAWGTGFRVASIVPGVGSGTLVVVSIGWVGARRRRMP